MPEILECNEFVNADEIARGLSPFNSDSVAIKAGKLMLERIEQLLESKVNFAIETTLATKIYKHKILKAKELGYNVILIFFWLENVELAKERVKIRVAEGGHNIPKDVIERRYQAGIKNLFDIYLPIVDEGMIYDNTNPTLELLYTKSSKNVNIINFDKFKIIEELSGRYKQIN